MKIKAKINLICATESGVSKATGNPWKSKEAVLEITEGQINHTLAVRTMNQEIIDKMEKAVEGDQCEADVRFFSRAREFQRRDGTTAVIRSTEVNLVAFDVTEPKSF